MCYHNAIILNIFPGLLKTQIKNIGKTLLDLADTVRIQHRLPHEEPPCRCFEKSFSEHPDRIDLVFDIFPQPAHPFHYRRVRVIKLCVKRVGMKIGQVFPGEFDQGSG